jgi:hypothetical protein
VFPDEPATGLMLMAMSLWMLVASNTEILLTNSSVLRSVSCRWTVRCPCRFLLVLEHRGGKLDRG